MKKIKKCKWKFAAGILCLKDPEDHADISNILQELFMQKSSWEDKDEPQKQGWVRSGQSHHHQKPCRRPTGRRRITQAEQAWSQKLTGRFEATSRKEVSLAFKKAAPELGLDAALMCFMDLLFSWTKEVDWGDKGWPLVWPSNETLCEKLGFEKRTLQRVRRRAIDAGLIRMHEVGASKRWGRRKQNDRNGVVVEGCGYDLSPLAERREEFLFISEEAEARRKQRGVLRRACSAWRRKILGLVDYALQSGYEEKVWFGFAKEARSLAARAYQQQDISLLMELEHSLQCLHRQIEDALNSLICAEEETELSVNKSVDMSPVGVNSVTLNTTTNQLQLAKANTEEALTGNAQEDERSRFRVSTLSDGKDQKLAQTQSPKSLNKSMDQDVLNGFIVTPSLILKMAPAFRDWVSHQSASWQELEAVIPHVLRHLGISKHAWGQACLVFGKQKAISVIAVIEARHSMGLVRKPGGLLRAFVELHQRQELHLDKTLFGLLDTISTPTQ